MEAFDGYVLGRPRIDILEVKYVTDPNTVIANVLAGAIDVVLGGILSFEQVADVVARWPEGHMWSGGGNNSVIYSQFMDANPPIITNPQFRRALLMATNRQELLDTFQKGQGTISHTTVFPPDQPELAAVDRYIVKWPYDPRRAQETMQSVGYTKGSDGSLYEDGGQKLPTLELRTITREPQSKMVLVIADNWKQIGADTQTVIIPDQRANEAEYRATYPAFQLLNANTGFERFNMNQIPQPSNNYRGENRSRYADPEVTRLGQLYFVTIPFAERMDVAGQVIRKLTDEVVVFPLMIRVDANLIANRVKNLTGNGLWSVHEWAVGPARA
jgi:peptide/nickel transport system substrate-binding protein